MRSLSRVAAVAIGLGCAVTVAARAEQTRTIRAQISGSDLSAFAVENLLGTMRISTGTGPSVAVVATVHAESAELADAVRLERVDGAGPATLRVRYPYDRVSTFRYRPPGQADGFSFGFGGRSSYDYDGHRVHIESGRGTRLWADLEIVVPPGPIHGAFGNLAGLVEAEGLGGRIAFHVESADLRLRGLDGDLALDGSSGDIHARDIRGTWVSDFASGDCDLDGFDGDALNLTTSSGDLILRSVRARRIEIETSSGDARLEDAGVEEFASTTSSGDVRFRSTGSDLRDARIRTSSGDVSLRLPASASFEVDADQSSGDMEVGFSDGTLVRRRGTLVGYRRGSGGARIRVETSSGDLSISPG
jgi:DUF4097 and DUF4098 domain-containing protein YvlB